MLRNLLIGVVALAGASASMSASLVRLRTDSEAISPDRARALSASVLADRLLEDGHPPVGAVSVGPEGMEPPTPPGSPIATRIKFYFAPARSTQRGFCERTIATLFLKPADRLPDGTIAASRADTLSTRSAYRWIDPQAHPPICGGKPYEFFLPPPEEVTQALGLVRRLAAASHIARTTRSLPFAVTLDDRMGTEMTAFDRAHPGKPPSGIQVISDPRLALASLPLDRISYAGPAAHALRNVLTAEDVRSAEGRPRDGRIVFAADWTIGLVLDRGKIVRLRMRRAIPTPF